LVFFVDFYLKNKDRGIQTAMVIAGIFGNLIDRIMLGHVTDFIHFRYFAIFNVADSAICVGVLWLILLDYKDKKP
ncbi:MAG: signal peptidase II, partial [Nanoarchaeota archaeon]|nr:signal peptidase II [Nanoarchaeota archaeon]